MLLINILIQANLIATPESTGTEEIVRTLVLWLIILTEALAAIAIGLGIWLTVKRLVVSRRKGDAYETARLTLARFLALALEFQLAADVLGTAVAPSWTQIGKLGAIAVIRTALNYFLAGEIKEEEESIGGKLDTP